MMKYTLEKNLRKTCKNCHKTFKAARTSVLFCSKKCNTKYKYTHNLKAKIAREKKQSERDIVLADKKEDSDIFWKKKNILKGYPALADYLNIGEEELHKRWSSVPSHHASLTLLKKTGFKTNNALFFLKKEVDTWAEETGFWTLKEPHVKNYKEPLKKVPLNDGFGYMGAVTVTASGDGIQCHVCGKFYEHLSGHIHNTHKMKVPDYKEHYQLAYTTPLTSDNHREHLKIKELEFIKNMTPEQKLAFRSRGVCSKNSKRSMGQVHKISLETKNKRGTCPDQLIDQIMQCQRAIGKSPSKKDFIVWSKTQRYVHLIYQTFGSWKKALELAGVQQSTRKAAKKIKSRWDNEELLEYLNIFYENTGKSPTQTDWFGGDLPNYSIYIKRFGSITRAREEAGVPHPLASRKGKKYITTPDMIRDRQNVSV